VGNAHPTILVLYNSEATPIVIPTGTTPYQSFLLAETEASTPPFFNILTPVISDTAIRHQSITEQGILPVCTTNGGTSQASPTQVRATQIGIIQNGISESRFSNIRPTQISFTQIGTIETGLEQIAITQVSTSQVSTFQNNLIESSFTQINADQSSLAQVFIRQINTSEISLPSSITLQQILSSHNPNLQNTTVPT
jgi:hypothetical protein